MEAAAEFEAVPQPAIQSEPIGFEKFDPRSVPFERVGWGIFLGIVVFAAAVTLGPIALGGIGKQFFITGACFLTACGLITFMLFWMPRRDYEAKRLRLDDLGIEYHHGVFFKHRHLIPRSRIQHTDVSQGPLQRRFGLATLRLHTAGTTNATVSMEGLSHDRAVELRDRLSPDEHKRNIPKEAGDAAAL